MALPRFHAPLPCTDAQPGDRYLLSDAVSRHIQVLRLQPADPVVLFGEGDHEWICRIAEMGRKSVSVTLERRLEARRELPVGVQLAPGMPANDRMDWLIEKATELGAASVQPLLCNRSVLKLEGERAIKRVAHWNSVAASSAEQSGRTCLLQVRPVLPLSAWLAAKADEAAGATARYVLSTGDAPHLSALLTGRVPSAPVDGIVLLSGPEGGLSLEEEAAAVKAGFVRASLGPRVLRADTAPLAALAVIAAYYEGGGAAP